MKRPGVGIGALIGFLLTAPLIAILFLGWRWAGLPFVPFDVFDELSRRLPGPLITRSIDAMVVLIRALHLGATGTVAKAAEQTMAVVAFLGMGVIAAVLLFGVRRRTEGPSYLSGLFLGLIIGVPVAVAVIHGRTATGQPAVGVLWVLALLLGWGLMLAWIHDWPASSSPVGRETATVEALNRRQLLIRLGEASAVVTVAGAVVGALKTQPGQTSTASEAAAQRWSTTHRLPNAQAEVEPAPGTRPEFTPLEMHYRIDINTAPPVIRESEWKLSITGLVERPLDLTLEEIRRYEPKDQFVTLSCISNLVGGDLIGTTRWTGVSLQRILADVRPLADATHLKITSADGFFETVALETVRTDERVMLAYAWDGVALLPEHGFPLRIYIPDRYGMKQPKWIRSIEAIDHSEAGYWVERGWDAVARMRATSVIDTISSNMMIVNAGGTVVPIGGIAHAGARGISKVQLRVDDGPWSDARLRTPLSTTTWVIWRYDWPFQAGRHTFTVRCFESDGTPQIDAEAPPHPSGATGLDIKRVML